MPRKLTTQQFIKKAKSVHGDTYDYSLVEYKNNKTKVKIICKEHGEFLQSPNNHLNGQGCHTCALNRMSLKYSLTQEEYITKCIAVHENKYDYSKVKYKNANSVLTIVCKVHREFKQKASHHLYSKYGCPKCGVIKTANAKRITTPIFINKAKEVHGDTFVYNKVLYKSNKEKVDIECKKHGVFKQSPQNHLQGNGCYKCAREKTNSFIRKNPNGWSHYTWQKSGERSKNFDSFKVYIIKCFNENEEFYKIGKTFRKIKNRFECKNTMPYNYEVIKTIKGESKEICELENQLQKENKEQKYIPKIYFDGMHECFKSIKING